MKKSVSCCQRTKAATSTVDNQNLKYFEDLGSLAYNILRKNAHTFINLLTLMLVSEIS